jgi:hypothetical protein
MGKSGLSGRQKLFRGSVWEALETLLIARWLMPRFLRYKLKSASKFPVFLLNNDPACFYEQFYPDADAVYVTHRGEIETTMLRLGASSITNDLDRKLLEYAERNSLLFLHFVKNL